MFAFIQTLNSTCFSTQDSGLADTSLLKLVIQSEALDSRPGVETGGHLLGRRGQAH